MRRSLLLLVVLAVPAAAQVNTERLRRSLNDDGLGLSITATGAYATGNTNFLQLGVGGRADLLDGEDQAFVVGEYQFSRAGGDDFDDRSFLHARYNRDLGPVVGELFAQFERNRQQLLEARTLLGAGVRLVFFDTEAVGLAGGVTPMLEHERLSEAAQEERDTVGRLSTYLSARVRLSDAASLWAVSYIQPQIDEVEDYRVLGQTGIEVGITRWLRLRTQVHLRYDNHPPLGVERTDVRIENGLVLVFPARRPEGS